MILLSTSSLLWYGLHRIFSFAKKSGFDGIDLTLIKGHYDLWDEDYILHLSREFQIPVLSITAVGRWMDEKKVDQVISMAIKLGSQVVTFSPPHFSDKNTIWFTRHLLKVKRDTHLSIAIQNVEPKFIFFLFPEYKNSTLTEIKKVTGDTTLDISSIDSSSWMDILKAQKILGSSVKNIFLSDKQGPKKGLLPGMAWWGISHLALESFFMKLKTTGYNWFISLKVRASELWVWTEQKVLQNLQYSIDYYKKHFLNYK